MVETLGGKSTPGVGFALGLERLLTALEYEQISLIEEESVDIYVIPMEESSKAYTQSLLQTLRFSGFSCDADYMNRNVKSNFKHSERIGARYLVLVGDEEIENHILTIKDNQTKEEFKVNEEDIIDFFDERLDEE